MTSAEKIFREAQDHRIFSRESLTVETEGGELIPMDFANPKSPAFSPGQVRLNDAIFRQRLACRPIRIIYLKSRRIRATTGTAAHFFQSTTQKAGVHTMVFAQDKPSVDNIFTIYDRFHRTYRPFGNLIRLPRSRPFADRINYEFGGDPESSWIHIHTAGNLSFGRGFRLTNVHFSEYPYYEDPRATRTAVMATVPKTADTCVIVEGTARAIGDDFQELWQLATDSGRESEWVGLFMGWHEHPANRIPLSVPADRFQESLSADEREIMRRLGLSLEQMNWRRWCVVNDFNGDMSGFRREHPSTPEEAFTAGSRNRFSIPHVQRMPIVREAMVGELVLEDVGQEKRAVFRSGEAGALRIYRLPEKGRAYAAGADPSGGADANNGKGEADPDWAVCQILDRDTGEQCAVLRVRLMPGEFGRYLNLLLRWYNNAQIAIEKNGAGIGSLESLLNANYPTSLFYHRPTSPDQDPVVRSDKIGWSTDQVSRQQLLSALDEAIRVESIFIHDVTTQRELFTFTINPKGKAEAQKGCHDDTVMALALAVIVMTRMPRPVPPDPRMAAPKVGTYGRQGDGDGRGRRTRF